MDKRIGRGTDGFLNALSFETSVSGAGGGGGGGGGYFSTSVTTNGGGTILGFGSPGDYALTNAGIDAGFHYHSGKGEYGRWESFSGVYSNMTSHFENSTKVKIGGSGIEIGEKWVRLNTASQGGDKFYDADIRYISESIPYNSFFGGYINTQMSVYNDYKSNGLNSYGGKLLMHEYGHYLQNKYGGSLWYNIGVVPTSIFNIKTMNPYMYDRIWTEVQANTMSYYYFNYPSFWDFNAFPINHSYISDGLKSILYYHKP